MKRLLVACAMLGLAVLVTPPANADELSVDYFYDNLSGGSWIEVEGYGYCWQPDVAVDDASWRPYTDGYWAYTDLGWTWISYEDFGWATYHYGRWARLSDYGWVWVPGADLEWGPAWVSWRTGGDYIGWAPLPPRGPEVVYEGQPIGPQVDITFDIGPEYYNFCDVRYIGEPVLRQRIIDYRQNVTYVRETVNVTNITVQNNVVYNYGPNINIVNERSSRPIQRLHLERQQNVDLATAAKTGAVTKVQGNNLIVAAPLKLEKPQRQVAPRQVKTKVAQAKIDKGWAGIDPNTQNQIKEKVKTEDHSKIPPPTGPNGPTGAAASANAGGAVGTNTPRFSPSPGAGTPAGELGGKGKHGGRRGQESTPGTSASPSFSTMPSQSVAPGNERGRKGRHGEPPGLGATVPPTSPEPSTGGVTAPTGGKKTGHELNESSMMLNKKGGNVGPSPSGSGLEGENLGGRHGRRGEMEGRNVLGPSPSVSTNEAPGDRHGKHNKAFEQAGPTGGPGNQNENPNPPGSRKNRFEQPLPGAAVTAPETSGPNNMPRAKHNVENPTGPSGPGGAPGGAPAEGKHGKQKGEKGSPSPAPQ